MLCLSLFYSLTADKINQEIGDTWFSIFQVSQKSVKLVEMKAESVHLKCNLIRK